MDWFTWLSRTGLDHSLIYNYARTFSSNELQKDDISYLNHEILQSMGVSIAKHRLEILKVAKKEKDARIRPVVWLKFAIKQTKGYICKHVCEFVHRENSKVSVLPTRGNSLRWKLSMLQRNKKWMDNKPDWGIIGCDNPQETLMLTHGSPIVDSQSSCSTSSILVESKGGILERDMPAGKRNSSFSSSMVNSQDGGYWSSSMEEEIKWGSMFHLKPT